MRGWQSPLDKAHAELKRARKAIESLRHSRNLRAALQEWIAFLHTLERAWNKTRAGMKLNSKWRGWAGRGEIEELRANDPLLAYLVNARGAEEHSIASVAEITGGGLGIGPAQGNSMYIERLTVNRGRIDVKSPQPLRLTFYPGQLELKDVVNRGRRYAVPSVHLNRPLPTREPLVVAEAGLAFYENALKRIEIEVLGYPSAPFSIE